MLELLLCSMLTILPDYLYRRYRQGKRFGREITLYSVWFELRWGITTCLMLTVALIAVVFYNHPSTNNATVFFRTVPIYPERIGRVAEVFVGFSSPVKKGEPILRLDSSEQDAMVETHRRKIAEIDAQMITARADIAAAEGQVGQAVSAHKQAVEELETKQELMRRSPDIVPRREIERLQVVVDGRQAAIDSAEANKNSAELRLSTSLPAQRASAEASLATAEVEQKKSLLIAGFDGRVEQFTLRPGDLVNPFLRPAGVMIPAEAGRGAVQAGFDQIEGQIMKPGMVAEITCFSKPWTVVPMVITTVQNYVAAGQFKGGDTLVDPQQVLKPGTLLVNMEPMFEGGLDGVTPGSSCIANAYSSNHERIASGEVGGLHAVALHAVDAVGLVHALLLRIQTAIIPVKALVFSGGH